MTKIISVVLAVVFGVLVGTLVADAVTTISTNIVTGGTLTVDLTSTFTGDVTMSGGDNALIITTSNSATSTLDVGCIQTTATSTDTPVRFVLSSAGTTTATYGAGTASGGVSWQYGTCPI